MESPTKTVDDFEAFMKDTYGMTFTEQSALITKLMVNAGCTIEERYYPIYGALGEPFQSYSRYSTYEKLAESASGFDFVIMQRITKNPEGKLIMIEYEVYNGAKMYTGEELAQYVASKGGVL